MIANVCVKRLKVHIAIMHENAYTSYSVFIGRCQHVKCRSSQDLSRTNASMRPHTPTHTCTPVVEIELPEKIMELLCTAH